jgi:hypothetical protein
MRFSFVSTISTSVVVPANARCGRRRSSFAPRSVASLMTPESTISDSKKPSTR